MIAQPFEIIQFEKGVRNLRPDGETSVSAPFANGDRWWIDLRVAGHHTALSWLAGRGFEFYPEDEPSFGLKPELWVPSADEALYHLRTVVFASWGLAIANPQRQMLRH